MKSRILTKLEVEAEPFLVWNAYVDLLAMEDYSDLTPQQRAAHLVFWYESEVQNGGHLQYFENQGTEHLSETITALSLLGATCQQQILHEASKLWLSSNRTNIQSAEEYCDIALQGEFEVFDLRFHACTPTLQQCLGTYLELHQSVFVTIT